MRASLVLVLVASCWRNTGNETAVANGVPEETETPRRKKGASCDEVAASVRRTVALSGEDGLVQRADQIARVVVERCTVDTWSMEFRRCLAGAKTLDDAEGCENLATPEQADALDREIEMMENAD